MDLDGRQSQIDAVHVDAAVQPDGSVRVEQRYRFASDDGGTVALPAPLVNPALSPEAQLAVGGIRNLTVDGAPTTPTGATVDPELRVRGERATVAYEQVGAVQRHADVAVLRLDVLPSPEDASRQDPNVALSGTVALPGTGAFVDAHLHGGIDRAVTIEGPTVDFASDAPIWQPQHELDVAFSPELVPFLAAAPLPFLDQFRAEQAVRDATDATSESTLAELDTQEDLGRWIITAVAFGLPAIFWTVVLVGLARRLRDRRRAVGDVPQHVSEPPTASDPAVVAVLDGEGSPARRAVAGTVLDLARRKQLDVEEYGSKVVVKVPRATTGANENEQDVLAALRARATAEGVVEGERIWNGSTRWWRTYRKDAIRRARGMGLVSKWLPLAPLSGALITTGIGISLFFFTQPVVAGRVRRDAATLGAGLLGRLLFSTGGVTRVSEPRGGGEPTWFRAAMSAGNLHPVEIYVVCTALDEVPAGVHHFAPLELGLTTLRAGDHRDLLAAGTGTPTVAAAPCSLVLTGIPFRTAWKYGERGYRHLFWDAGSMLANLLAIADSFGLSARVYVGFVDHVIGALVGVDGVEELPLAVVTIGHGDDGAPAVPDAERVTRLELATTPVAPRPIRFPLIEEAHDDGRLADADAVAAWRAAGTSLGLPTPDELDVPAGAGTEPLEDVIVRRGSTRLMRPDPVPPELLAWGIGVAARPVPGDFTAAGHTLLQHFLAVHAVEDVEPGAYRWRSGLLEQRRAGEHRELTAHLCLDQPLGGDAAFTTFHMTDLDSVLATLGSRGYRAAHLEAGIAAERLALAAFTLGGGATGLTFFDELASQFFGTRTQCLLVTAAGVPAYRNRAGGTPGAPTELAHFDQLMTRLTSRLRGGC